MDLSRGTHEYIRYRYSAPLNTCARGQGRCMPYDTASDTSCLCVLSPCCLRALYARPLSIDCSKDSKRYSTVFSLVLAGLLQRCQQMMFLPHQQPESPPTPTPPGDQTVLWNALREILEEILAFRARTGSDPHSPGDWQRDRRHHNPSNRLHQKGVPYTF